MKSFSRQIRKVVQSWRDNHYEGATGTPKALLNWWFGTEHLVPQSETMMPFQYYFAQREAIETIIYLYEVAQV